MAVKIKKVGVIGSGQMGSGIAHVAALAGLDVVLNDVSADRLKSGMATVNGNLLRQVSKKIITEDAAFLQKAPHTLPNSRPDEVKAAKEPVLRWNMES